jgi:hypothetical protein
VRVRGALERVRLTMRGPRAGLVSAEKGLGRWPTGPSQYRQKTMDLARRDWRLIGCLSKKLRDEHMHAFWTLAERVPNESLSGLILGRALRGTCDALQGLPRLRTSTEAL